MTTLPEDHPVRMNRARRALLGVAMGDAFGQRFFGEPGRVLPLIEARTTPSVPVWTWTDDTAMTLSVVEELDAHGCIDRDALGTVEASPKWI